MSTTRWTSIRDGYITAIRALTPTSLTEISFDQRPVKARTLEEWATESPSQNVMRKFEILRDTGGEEADFMDPTEYEVREDLLLRVAYPAELHNLFGSNALDDLETIMEQDGDQLRDTITSASNYQAGQNLARVASVATVRDDENVWFLELAFELRYYKSQSL